MDDLPTPPVLLPVLRTVLVSGDDARFCHLACSELRFDHKEKNKASPYHGRVVMTWCAMFEEPLSGKTAPKRGAKCLAATEAAARETVAARERIFAADLLHHVEENAHRWHIAREGLYDYRRAAKTFRKLYEGADAHVRMVRHGYAYGNAIAQWSMALRRFLHLDRELRDCKRWAS